MTKLSNPVPVFFDGAGNLLDGGYIYVGVANADPKQQPIQLYWDYAQTIPAAQPLRTIGGRIVNGATPTNVFFAAADFSIRVLDSNQAQVSYQATTYLDTTSYQPLDADLTAIAAQGTQPFGLSLLNLANAAALAAATGVPPSLPLTGGVVSGPINRQSRGVFLFFQDPNMTGGGLYVTNSGDSDPTQNPGDVWAQLQ